MSVWFQDNQDGSYSLVVELRGHTHIATFHTWRQLHVTLIRWRDDKRLDFNDADAFGVCFFIGKEIEAQKQLTSDDEP